MTKTSKELPLSVPRVWRLSMYRSGVGYVERAGTVTGSFSIPVRNEHMNDVLATVHATGAVAAVSFDSKVDAARELARRGLNVEPTNTLRSLCTGKLRGQGVRVNPFDSETTVTGMVLGLDTETVTRDGDTAEEYSLSLYTDKGIRRIPFVSIDTIEPVEGTVREDLNYLMETARTDARTQPLNVRVAGTDVAVGLDYLVPAPVWMMKYDLDIDSKNGVAALTPWAVVHNPLDEPLTDIQLRLTTGRPVSFTMEFLQPQSTNRARVETDLSVNAPVARTAMARAAAVRARPAGLESLTSDSRGDEVLGDVGMAYESMKLASMEPQATVTDAPGEETEFVLDGVTLPASGAATVPLTVQAIAATEERVWREGGSANPERAIVIRNGTDMVLEKGAVAIRSEGRFVGQAILPHMPKGAAGVLGYGRDQAVTITRKFEDLPTRVKSIRAGDDVARGVFIQEVVRGRQWTAEVRSLHAHPVDITLEIPRWTGYAPVNPDAVETTESHWRIKIVAKPATTTSVAFVATSTAITSLSLLGQSLGVLDTWSKEGALSLEMRDGMERTLRAQAAYQTASESVATLERELKTLTGIEDGLVEKLKTLVGTYAANAQKRYSEDLETINAKIHAKRTEIEHAQLRAEDARKILNAALAVFSANVAARNALAEMKP